jgi:hypothetical protein
MTSPETILWGKIGPCPRNQNWTGNSREFARAVPVAPIFRHTTPQGMEKRNVGEQIIKKNVKTKCTRWKRGCELYNGLIGLTKAQIPHIRPRSQSHRSQPTRAKQESPGVAMFRQGEHFVAFLDWFVSHANGILTSPFEFYHHFINGNICSQYCPSLKIRLDLIGQGLHFFKKPFLWELLHNWGRVHETFYLFPAPHWHASGPEQRMVRFIRMLYNNFRRIFSADTGKLSLPESKTSHNPPRCPHTPIYITKPSHTFISLTVVSLHSRWCGSPAPCVFA